MIKLYIPTQKTKLDFMLEHLGRQGGTIHQAREAIKKEIELLKKLLED